MLTRNTLANRFATALIALNLALLASGAAQSANAPAANTADEELGEVVITGSRLATGFDMPTPVAIYQSEELAKAAPNNLSEALGQLPQLLGSTQGSTSGAGSGNSGTNGQSLLSLRSLGANRTLILLDGQRMGVTNVAGSVDIGTVPQNLVKRVDIVTGGASASYGSDAVAGAVNFVLDTGFQGLKAEATGGITTYRDNKNGKLSLAYGKQFAGGRARVIGAMEYFKMGGMTYGEETGRYWFDHPTGAWANPTTGAQPSIINVPNAVSDYGTYGGTITTMSNNLGTGSTCQTGAAGDTCRALVNQRFLPGGALTPMNFGAFHNPSNTAASFAGGGDGAIANQPFTPDTLRRSFFLHGEYDVSPNLTLFADAMHNNNQTFLASQVVSQLTTTQFTIFEGNAYLPAAVNTIFAANTGTQAFSLTRYDRDFGLQQDYDNVIVRRVAFGAKGRINDSWTYDTTVTQQNTNQLFDIKVTNLRNLYAAADAVVNPANGQIVCRSTIYASPASTTPAAGGTTMDPGCVPLNLFGDGAVSQAAANYVMGVNHANIALKQTTFDANVRGDFGERFSLGAGAISFASGAAWRRQTVDRTVDGLSAIYLNGDGIRGWPSGLTARYGGYQFYNPSPIAGVISVKEAYTEFGLPLLKDKPLVNSLAATLAGRLSDYSQSGIEKVWKLGLNWTLNDAIRIRGTLSADTRAPSVLDLFNTSSVTQGRNNVPCTACVGAIRSSGQNVTTGNPSLKPEHARTYTAGFVFSPSFVPGFQASLDWYKIKVVDSISTPGAGTLIDQCYAGDQVSCGTIIVNGSAVTTTKNITANDFVVVTTKPTNTPSGVTQSGLDFATAYTHQAGPGKLGLRLSGIYLLRVETTTGCTLGSTSLNVTNSVGAIGGCGTSPKITGRVTASYDVGRFGIDVAERYIDHGVKNPNYVTGIDITDNHVPSMAYTDFNFTYQVGQMFGGDSSMFLNVTNVFDKDPPNTATSARSWVVPTDFGLYDVQGRRYTLGVRFKL